MPDRPPRADRPVRARTQVIVAFGTGVIAAVLATVLTGLKFGTLLGYDVAVVVYISWVWARIWPCDAAETERLAAAEDPTRGPADVMLLGAAVASLVAVGFVLVGSAGGTALSQLARVGLGVASVVLSWGLVHTVFTLRYACQYYAGTPGGIDYNEPDRAAYSDFAYLSLTIGMTFQVSDTDLQTKAIRRVALRHALLSYVFGAGILATTINLIASLSSK